MQLPGFILLILCYLTQIFFYLKFFRKIKNIRGPNQSEGLSVSVIVVGKNEAENIKTNLPRLCTQDYPNFEVLYMDDHSTDDTNLIVNELCKKYKHLKHLNASDSIKGKKGKKWALKEAREAAGNEIILLTDADCIPDSSLWIKHMVSKFDSHIDVVLGIGQYKRERGMLNILLQYETLFTALSYLGFAAGGSAYMGVGRNLAYRKSIPQLVEEKGMEILSGDDDLFLQSRLNESNAAICIENGSFTTSLGPKSFGSWVRQKKRHYSAAFHYSLQSKSLLFLLKFSFYLPNYLFLCLILTKYALAMLALFVVRSLLWARYLNKIGTRLHFPRRIYLVPCYEIFFSLFDTWITITNLMTKPRRWK